MPQIQDLKPKKQKVTAAERAHQKRLTVRRRFTENHLGMPWAEWQTKKRQEWRAVTDALKKFHYGSAYTPARELWDVDQIVARISEAMAEDWVSW